MVKFILMLMLAPLLCFANPAPFGLEIGKMTFQEFKEKYDHKYEGDHKDSKSSSYSISPEIFNFNGLKEISVKFDRNQVLASIFAVFDVDKYHYLLDILKDKYKVTDKMLIVESEKNVCFGTDELNIILNVSDLNDKVEMMYLSKNFWNDLFNNYKKEKEKEKEKDFFKL